MHLRRRRQVTTAGLAVCVIALAACSSSSSSSSSSSAAAATSSALRVGQLQRRPQRHAQRERIDVPARLPAGGHPGLQVGPVQHDGQLRWRRLGQGAHGPGLGGGQLRGLGLADPRRRDGELQGQDGALLPRLDRPDHGLVQPVGPQQALQLSAPVIAGIFQAKITTWNNSAIAADNPGVTLPSTPITIAVRSDSSGTTQNFSQFLVDATGDGWTLGTSSTIKWPATARAGNGNGGVASIIKSTPGAVGYVDYADAKASGLTFASIKNSSGDYVAPSVAGASAAADQRHLRPNLTFSAIWASGASSYPISLSRGFWSTRLSRTRTTRSCSRPRSAT